MQITPGVFTTVTPIVGTFVGCTRRTPAVFVGYGIGVAPPEEVTRRCPVESQMPRFILPVVGMGVGAAT